MYDSSEEEANGKGEVKEAGESVNCRAERGRRSGVGGREGGCESAPGEADEEIDDRGWEAVITALSRTWYRIPLLRRAYLMYETARRIGSLLGFRRTSSTGGGKTG